MTVSSLAYKAPTNFDVLLGRDPKLYGSAGNRWLDDRIAERIPLWDNMHDAKDIKGKTRVIDELATMVHQRGGRHLKREKDGLWYSLPFNCKVVRDRISKRLNEHPLSRRPRKRKKHSSFDADFDDGSATKTKPSKKGKATNPSSRSSRSQRSTSRNSNPSKTTPVPGSHSLGFSTPVRQPHESNPLHDLFTKEEPMNGYLQAIAINAASLDATNTGKLSVSHCICDPLSISHPVTPELKPTQFDSLGQKQDEYLFLNMDFLDLEKDVSCIPEDPCNWTCGLEDDMSFKYVSDDDSLVDQILRL